MGDWHDAIIAVDWGTSNRRAYAIARDGNVHDRIEDSQGVLSVPPGGFADAIGALRQRLGGAPMLLAGMVGSSIGWIETPYVAAPVDLNGIAAAVCRVADDVAIVPGVSVSGGRCDVMRGEEVQVLGAVAASLAPRDARFCHPGTHSKWITMSGGAIVDFRTAMTGEVFALLREHGVLAAHMRAEACSGAAFLSGVDLALSGEPLLDALFSVRARTLLGALDAADAASYASGLLIGTDVAAHARAGESVVLLGRPELCDLYAAALDRAGCETRTIDGAEAFVAGMAAIRSLMK